MAQQQTDFAKELREKIAEYPERSLALAVLGGFAIGGGLSNRTSFQIILMVLEGSARRSVDPGDGFQDGQEWQTST